jgi:hypothetical protein
MTLRSRSLSRRSKALGTLAGRSGAVAEVTRMIGVIWLPLIHAGGRLAQVMQPPSSSPRSTAMKASALPA